MKRKSISQGTWDGKDLQAIETSTMKIQLKTCSIKKEWTPTKWKETFDVQIIANKNGVVYK